MVVRVGLAMATVLACMWMNAFPTRLTKCGRARVLKSAAHNRDGKSSRAFGLALQSSSELFRGYLSLRGGYAKGPPWSGRPPDSTFDSDPPDAETNRNYDGVNCSKLEGVPAGYDSDGKPYWDDDTDRIVRDPEWENHPNKWPEYPTESETSHDMDPDDRGAPIKTPNVELQKQLDVWYTQLQEANSTADNNTRLGLLYKFAMGFAPLDMPRADTENFAEELNTYPEVLSRILTDIRRCATGVGIKSLLDHHILHAGFEQWEMTSKKGDYNLASYCKFRRTTHYSLHDGKWRMSNHWSDLQRKDVPGDLQEPGLVGTYAPYENPLWDRRASFKRDPRIPEDMWDPNYGWDSTSPDKTPEPEDIPPEAIEEWERKADKIVVLDPSASGVKMDDVNLDAARRREKPTGSAGRQRSEHPLVD
ncbi:hypothetical protein AAMO2058_001547100 [Amorphochlora amoebiformis]